MCSSEIQAHASQPNNVLPTLILYNTNTAESIAYTHPFPLPC